MTDLVLSLDKGFLKEMQRNRSPSNSRYEIKPLICCNIISTDFATRTTSKLHSSVAMHSMYNHFGHNSGNDWSLTTYDYLRE